MTVYANVYSSDEQVTAVIEDTNHIIVADNHEEVVEKITSYLMNVSGNIYTVCNEVYENNHTKLEFTT
ncbi:MAG: hypothetical protein E6R13_06625 [Spirochaetes bacterium]|nr:MAG: hypothetical protein E6R13_06625 [Spirochaetota bacterium]